MDNKKNVLLFLENKTEENENRIALGMKSYLGWKELSFRGLGILSKRLANYLIKYGINKGDKVAILSESMPEWGVALFSTVLSGAIAVPLDIKLTIYELRSILTDCQPKIILSSSAFSKIALQLTDEIESLEQVILLDETGHNNALPSLYTIPHDSTEVKWRHRSSNSTALIVYTSGTTGSPKGVQTSFTNVISQLTALEKCFNFGTKDQVLSILPMNHLFELTVGFLSFLNWGTSIYYSQSLKPKEIFNTMQDKDITFMIVVPAFLKLLKTSIEAEINQIYPKFYFDMMYQLSKFIPFFKIKKLMFKKIHKKFGGHFKGFISGGAPLDLKVGTFFENIGIKIYQGYGLSETSPILTINTDKHRKLMSVGRAIENVELKIDSNGEVLAKGPNLMKGYYNRPDLTEEVIDKNGWFHTGDIGHIDSEGFLFITGRIKNMIVLNGGKKVFPEEVEAVLEKSSLFLELCVIGATKTKGKTDGTEEIFVVIVPTEELIAQYQNDDEIEKAVKAEVKALSQQLASYKRPLNIIVRKEPIPRTATRKIKRQEVKKIVNDKF